MYVWVLWFLFPRWRWSSAWSLAWCPSVLRRAPTRCGSVRWRCGRWWWGCCPQSSCSCLGSPPRFTWPSPCWPSSPVRSSVYSRFFFLLWNHHFLWWINAHGFCEFMSPQTFNKVLNCPILWCNKPVTHKNYTPTNQQNMDNPQTLIPHK